MVSLTWREKKVLGSEQNIHQLLPAWLAAVLLGLAGGCGQGSAQTPQAFGTALHLLFGLFSYPLGGRVEKAERRKKRRRHICLPIVGQSPALTGSPSSFPPTLPSLQKVPRSSRRDLPEMPGAYHPAWGLLLHCVLMVLLAYASLDCQLPDYRAHAYLFTHVSLCLANSRCSINACQSLDKQQRVHSSAILCKPHELTILLATSLGSVAQSCAREALQPCRSSSTMSLQNGYCVSSREALWGSDEDNGLQIKSGPTTYQLSDFGHVTQSPHTNIWKHGKNNPNFFTEIM